MKFTATLLNKNSGSVLQEAMFEPVEITKQGKVTHIIMSVRYYKKLIHESEEEEEEESIKSKKPLPK